MENRVNLVRCANTGVSAFIAPNGKIISLIRDKKGNEIFVDGFKTQEIALEKKKVTNYTRYGDFFIILLLIAVIYSIFRFRR